MKGDGEGGGDKASKKQKEVEEFVDAMNKGGVKKEVARDVLKKWEEAGVGGDDPKALRRLFLQQSAYPIAGTLLQTLIDAAAAYSIFNSALFFGIGPEFFGKGFLVIALNVLSGYFAVGVLFDVATLIAILVTTAKMGTSVDSFYAALKAIAAEGPPATGISVVDKAAAAVNAIKVAQALDAIAKMLDAAGGTKVADTLSNLSALLLLSKSEKRDGFDPAALSMSEAEAADLALKFTQFDLNTDDRLDASEVRLMAGKLGIELSAAEAGAAIQAMDRNSDGLIEFSEWAQWYAVRKGKVPASP
ncbi:MAG: hypothetical protein J3K34DRAFT_470080 [Monoraphidium minutum]|nr:MAG: hypothetical protein J3K34DRAFT_470080 [Monoraphidium minutum]